MTIWEFDAAVRAEGYPIIAGIDEAGRGPLCGPVCAAAVILPPDLEIAGINDSKKLTEKKREELFDQITSQAITYGIGFAEVEEIEEINILNATYLAMCRAAGQLSETPALVLVDGNRTPSGLELPSRTVVKGDAKSASIAAASILAKVSRDRLLLEMDKQYPEYGFAQHKGYGTATHYEALRKYGPCPAHRMSFLRKFFEEQ